jgi:hypothetical protein
VYYEPGQAVEDQTVSPDGDSVAFTRLNLSSGDAEQYTIPITGGPIRQITDAADNSGRARWSPDGRILLFHRRVSAEGRIELFKVSTQNPQVDVGAKFFAPPSQDAALPAYAPDSQVVVCALGPADFAGPRSTALVETTAPLSTIQAITSNYPTYLHVGLSPIVSPDGTRLALMALNPSVPNASSPQVFASRRNMSEPPRFTNIGSHAVADSSTTVSDAPTVGQNFSFTVTATDQEGDVLSYDAYFLREGMTFTRSTRTFSWTPPSGTVDKTFNVVFIVTTQSGGTDVIIDKLTVGPCCLGPQARAVQTGGAEAVEGPNPTAGRFVLATPPFPGARAELDLFDVSGRRVARVLGPSGSPLVWDGRGSEGERVPSGVYLYRLRVAGHERRGRVVLLP